MGKARGKHYGLWRELGEHMLDISLLNGLVARASYAMGLHGKLQVTRYEIRLQEQQRLPNPLKIAYVSDFHAGPTTDPRQFEAMFAAIEQAEPDLVLLGGDYVSCRAKYINALIAGLSRLQPRMGKFGVFGNHDLWADHDYMSEQLESAGVQLLINQNARLAPPFDQVWVCGTDDPWTGEVDLNASFAQADGIRLLLTHAPDGILGCEPDRFALAFAGHTHGGQLVFPNGTPLVLPHGPLGKKYFYGHFPETEHGALIVTRGVGCTNLPLRINADPEVVLVHLQ